MHSVSPNLFLDTRVFYSRNTDHSVLTTLAHPDPFPGVRLTVPSAFSIGRGAVSAIKEYEWGFSEHLSWNKGRHTYDFGGDIAHDTNVSVSYSGYNGTYPSPSLSAFALGQYSLYTSTPA